MNNFQSFSVSWSIRLEIFFKIGTLRNSAIFWAKKRLQHRCTVVQNRHMTTLFYFNFYLFSIYYFFFSYFFILLFYFYFHFVLILLTFNSKFSYSFFNLICSFYDCFHFVFILFSSCSLSFLNFSYSLFFNLSFSIFFCRYVIMFSHNYNKNSCY